MQIFITALFVIVKNWKPLRCPSADTGLKKLWNIHTMEYYSAMKKEPAVATYNNLNE